MRARPGRARIALATAQQQPSTGDDARASDRRARRGPAMLTATAGQNPP
jgi:hypothetical protein